MKSTRRARPVRPTHTSRPVRGAPKSPPSQPITEVTAPTKERPFVLRDKRGAFIHAVRYLEIANQLARALGYPIKVYKWMGDGRKEVLMSYNGPGWKRDRDEEIPTTPETLALTANAKKTWKRIH